jgi:hypothetical protein
LKNLPSVIAPIFLIKGTTFCYNTKCNERIDVVTLAASGQEPRESIMRALYEAQKEIYLRDICATPIMLTYIQYLPDEILNSINSMYPQFHLDNSQSIDEPYLMNHCEHCGYKQGDHFLHKSKGAPFNAFTDEEAHRLELTEIQTSGTMECIAHCGLGSLHLIMLVNKVAGISTAL